MQFSSHLATSSDTQTAIDEVCRLASESLDGGADLACLFVSHHHVKAMDEQIARIRDRLQVRCLLGCTGESIIGTGRECEEEPAVSLWLARLPGVELLPMQLDFQNTPEGGTVVGWPDDLPATWPDNATLLLLAEPFSFPADYLLQRLGEDQPGVSVLGGMASGAPAPGENRLYIDGGAVDSGAVAVLLSGAVQMKSIVSQGCRPIGQPLVITKADRNAILELAGKSALEWLRDIFQQLPTREQALVQQGLHVGRVVSEYQERSDDYLVRNVVGVDHETGAIAIGDYVRPGQTVRFHIRDEETADAELRELLTAAGSDAAHARAALLFGDLLATILPNCWTSLD